MCLICMKYRIIILIIIIISLGKISLSYIANTSRTHACMHVSVRPTMTPSWLSAPLSTLARQCRLAIYKQTCWRPDLTEVFDVFPVYKNYSAELRRELVTKICTVRRYGPVETSPETIEQELRPAVCEH